VAKTKKVETVEGADDSVVGTHRGDGTPHVEIGAGGSLLLNEAAYKALTPTHVVQLVWNREQRALSIQATRAKVDDSYWIIRHFARWPRPGIPHVATYSIDAATFFRLHQIVHSAARHYTPEVRDNTLIIYLK
jgi:hypothetical protein